MNEILAHLFGDFVLQNHWMASNKTKLMWVAIIHAAVYTLPFLVLTRDASALFVIFSTHAVIDHYRVGYLWTNLYGVGCRGIIPSFLTKEKIEPAPDHVRVWLTVVVDNAFHLLINHVALWFSGAT